MGDDMNWEPQIVKTVNLDYDQLLVVESTYGDTVCVIHRGEVLIARQPLRSGQPEGPNWRRPRSSIRGWWARLRMSSWKVLKPQQAEWVPL
jgi:hypothetical protein